MSLRGGDPFISCGCHSPITRGGISYHRIISGVISSHPHPLLKRFITSASPEHRLEAVFHNATFMVIWDFVFGQMITMVFTAGVCYLGTGLLPSGKEEAPGRLDVVVDGATVFLPGASSCAREAPALVRKSSPPNGVSRLFAHHLTCDILLSLDC